MFANCSVYINCFSTSSLICGRRIFMFCVCRSNRYCLLCVYFFTVCARISSSRSSFSRSILSTSLIFDDCGTGFSFIPAIIGKPFPSLSGSGICFTAC